MYRIGNGIDIHKYIPGTGFLLGGVIIPGAFAIEAHSDGDILYHALADAILGALALGDIGHHFPDTDPVNSNLDSGKIIDFVNQLMINQGYQISNLDSTVMAQKPKLAPHIVAIRQSIADRLCIELNQVSVKATTTEKLGYEGRLEGLTVYATVLLKKVIK